MVRLFDLFSSEPSNEELLNISEIFVISDKYPCLLTTLFKNYFFDKLFNIVQNQNIFSGFKQTMNFS